MIAVDPTNPDHLVGVWQQDRWGNGGASGNLTAVSMDRGATWTISSAPFSACTGGTYDRASDPWVTISTDGTVYQSAIGLSQSNSKTAVLVSRSSDGGITWSAAVTSKVDNTQSAVDPAGNDKEMIVADSMDPNHVYVVWDRYVTNQQPTWFAETIDGGKTWLPARPIYNPAGAFTSCTQMLSLPDGALVLMFVLAIGPAPQLTNIEAIRSSDRGLTWSTPVTVALHYQDVGVEDVKVGAGVRSGGCSSSAADPISGAIYTTWQDSRFSNAMRDGIALSKSLDGGVTWSAPVQVNQAPSVQAFLPTVAVNANGSVAVTYFDFRRDTSDPSVLLTNRWKVVSVDGGNSWRESPVASTFNLLTASMGGVLFTGDYMGLAAVGDGFLSFFVQTNPTTTEGLTSVIATRAETLGDTSSNGHIEINVHPRSPIRRKQLPVVGN
jgi:hypothetical protein